jgi:hypothetical protein
MFYNVFWFGLWVWLMVWLIFGLYLAYNWLMEFPTLFAIILFSLKPHGKHELHPAPPSPGNHKMASRGLEPKSTPRRPQEAQKGFRKHQSQKWPQEAPGDHKWASRSTGPESGSGDRKRASRGMGPNPSSVPHPRPTIIPRHSSLPAAPPPLAPLSHHRFLFLCLLILVECNTRVPRYC